MEIVIGLVGDLHGAMVYMAALLSKLRDIDYVILERYMKERRFRPKLLVHRIFGNLPCHAQVLIGLIQPRYGNALATIARKS